LRGQRTHQLGTLPGHPAQCHLPEAGHDRQAVTVVHTTNGISHMR
jgi:hypothetical protein